MNWISAAPEEDREEHDQSAHRHDESNKQRIANERITVVGSSAAFEALLSSRKNFDLGNWQEVLTTNLS